jgi:hypothetical protein
MASSSVARTIAVMSTPPDIPLYGSKEGEASPVVRCAVDGSHYASREAFDEVGGCPYCLHTADERIAALRAKAGRPGDAD